MTAEPQIVQLEIPIVRHIPQCVVKSPIIYVKVSLGHQHHGTEPVTPQQLFSQVRAPRLTGHSCRSQYIHQLLNTSQYNTFHMINLSISVCTCSFYHPLQDDHNLKVLFLQLRLWHVPERRADIDLVRDHQRRHQEETIVPRLETHTDIRLIQWNKLT